MRPWLGVIVLVCVSSSAWAATPFDQGRWRFSLVGGGSQFDGGRYIAIGGSVGVFVVDGLEVGVQLEQWFGSPSITQVSPQLRYVVALDTVSPYTGVFYRHWFILDRRDIEALGGRVGALILAGRSTFIGVGVVYEQILSPRRFAGANVYPELFISASF